MLAYRKTDQRHSFSLADPLCKKCREESSGRRNWGRRMDPEKGAKNTGNGKCPGNYVSSSRKFTTQE